MVLVLSTPVTMPSWIILIAKRMFHRMVQRWRENRSRWIHYLFTDAPEMQRSFAISAVFR
jgi:hypothetical protein